MESIIGRVSRGFDHETALPFRRTRCDGKVYAPGTASPNGRALSRGGPTAHALSTDRPIAHW